MEDEIKMYFEIDGVRSAKGDKEIGFTNISFPNLAVTSLPSEIVDAITFHWLELPQYQLDITRAMDVFTPDLFSYANQGKLIPKIVLKQLRIFPPGYELEREVSILKTFFFCKIIHSSNFIDSERGFYTEYYSIKFKFAV